MGTAIVATAHVSDLSELIDKLEKLQVGECSYFFLQCPNNITDWQKGHPEAAKVGRYTHGRLFGINGEVRWKKTADGYALLWLSERNAEDDLLEPFTALEGDWETSAPQNVSLLGSGETPPWRDTRIPRELKYPYPKGWCKSPQVRVIHYKDFRSQTIRFTRCTEFIE